MMIKDEALESARTDADPHKVGVSATESVLPAWSPDRGTRGSLLRVVAYAAVVVATVVAVVGFVGLFLERRDPLSFFAPFGGWQLDAVEAAVAVVVLAVGTAALIALVRLYRSLRGRTPHRRAMVLVALLPGLLLGGLALHPMRSAFTWGSNHTAAAAAAKQRATQWAINYRKAPPAVPLPMEKAAPSDMAALLLRVQDLGPGWYDASRPNPDSGIVFKDGAALGEVRIARATLTQQHWVGKSWSLDHFLVESETQFASVAAARRYVVGPWLHPGADPCSCKVTYGRTTMRKLRGVPVWTRNTSSGFGVRRYATFVSSDKVFTLSLDMKPSPAGAADLFNTALTRALQRALSSA